jgi:hypothetical protein
MSDDINQVPSAWSAYLPILAGLFRAVLAALGGLGFAWASAVTGSQIEMAAGAAMMLGAAGWSAWQKVAAIRASRASSVLSAEASARATYQAGAPVAVVTSAGTPTTTTDLNRAELARRS